MSTSQKKDKVVVTKRDLNLPPPDFKAAKFKSTPLEREEAQSTDNQLWLFQFPPQVTTEDFAKSGLTIPTQTKLTQAGKHVYIGSFNVHSIKYNLFEAPADEVSNIVNFWPSSETIDSGLVYRGKPFARLFIATVDVAPNLTGTRQVIDSMPLGYNKPFEPKPILLPVGLDNPWFGEKPDGQPKSENILKQFNEKPFVFTNGNYDLTEAENQKWLDENLPAPTTMTLPKTAPQKEEKKQQKPQQQEEMVEIRKSKKDKKDNAPQQTEQVAVKQEQQQSSKKSKQQRTDPAADDEEIVKEAKKQKSNSTDKNAQQLVKLDGDAPQESKKQKKKAKQQQ